MNEAALLSFVAVEIDNELRLKVVLLGFSATVDQDDFGQATIPKMDPGWLGSVVGLWAG